MAKAGDRYTEVTGNIWSYSKRGDATGVKAALQRNVCVNAVNTAGWTPLHAAAAGGQKHVVQLLLRAGADLQVRDRGGNMAVHEAARNGHLQCLHAFQDAGADLSEVRLSQTKGQEVRALVQDAMRKAAKHPLGDDGEIEGPVGYARQKQKSTAFWGPRRTPISTKIKRELLKEKRQRPQRDDPLISVECDVTANDVTDHAELSEHELREPVDATDARLRTTAMRPDSYADTIKAVKKQTRMGRRARQTPNNGDSTHSSDQEARSFDNSDDLHCDSILAATSGFACLAISDEE